MPSDVPAGLVGKHKFTLVASTVTTVTFDDDLASVEVMSDGTADVYYTLDGTNPSVGGTNSYRIPVNALGVDERQPPTSGGTVVKLISPGTPTLSVQRGS